MLEQPILLYIRELRLNISERFLWTDSQCVLHWLKTKKPLSVFVDNRIKEIKQQQNMTFRYIISSHNPSDSATRGLTLINPHYGGMDHPG